MIDFHLFPMYARQVFSHAILIALRLTEEEVFLLKYWLKPIRYRFYEGEEPTQLSSGAHCILTESLSVLERIVSWNFPVILITGKNSDSHRQELAQVVFRNGVAAWWTIPPSSSPLFFPPLQVAGGKGRVHMLVESSPLRKIFRQMLLFAGYDVRGDFRSTREMAELYRELAESSDYPGSSFRPNLFFVDMDMAECEVDRIVEAMRYVFIKKPEYKKDTRILCIKDITIPSPGLTQRLTPLRPWVQRIFHPHEAILIILESLLLNGMSEKNSVSYSSDSSSHEEAVRTRAAQSRIERGENSGRSLDDLLFGNQPLIQRKEIDQIVSLAMQQTEKVAAILPFLWIQDLLMKEEMNRGITLASPASEQKGEREGTIL